MVHIPSTYTYDFWLRSSTDLSVELSCLMPNGVFIPLEVKKNATLQEIKEVIKLFGTVQFRLHTLCAQCIFRKNLSLNQPANALNCSDVRLLYSHGGMFCLF